MTAYEAFKADLEEAIRRAGSALKLADALGLAPSVITRWRNGDRVPMLDKVQPIYDYLGKSFGAQGPRSKPVTPAPQAAAVKKRVEELEKEVGALKRELYQKNGEIVALERQLARLTPAPGSTTDCPVSPSWKTSVD